MTNEPENLVLEHLRHIRASGDKTNRKLTEIEQPILELRLQVASLVREDALVHTRLAEFEVRFERIEARLGLSEV